jgi:hypothetical protein
MAEQAGLQPAGVATRDPREASLTAQRAVEAEAIPSGADLRGLWLKEFDGGCRLDPR